MNAQTLPPGTRLGPYEVQEILGRGGMGVVYKARDVALGRAVALKVLSEDTSDPAAFQRFEREARAAAQLQHPNLAVVHFVSLDPRQPFVALELLTGGSLADRLKHTGPLPWREAARLGAQVARGLEAVHGAGFVHRDMKPANVLLDAAGTAKLTDFGLVRKRATDGARSQGLTATGEIVGTVEYVAPEQVDSARTVDGRADLYSLGASLYTLVTGSTPFDGIGFSQVKKHLQDIPRAPRERAPDLPVAFNDLILALLEKSPDDRPQTAAEVAAALDAIGTATEKVPDSSRGLLLVVSALIAIGLFAILGFAAFMLGRQHAFSTPTSTPPPSAPVAATPPLPRSTPTPSPGRPWRAIPSKRASPWARLNADAHLTAVLGETTFRHPDFVASGAVSRDGRSVFTADSTSVRCTTLATGEDQWVHHFSWSPESALAISDNTIVIARASGLEILDAGTGETHSQSQPGDTLGAAALILGAVAASPKGHRIAAGVGADVVLTDLVPGTAGLALKPSFNERVLSTAFSPSGDRVAGTSAAGEIRIWEVRTGKLVSEFRAQAATRAGLFLDEDTLATGIGSDLVAFGVSAQAIVWRGPGHTDEIRQLALDADGATLYSASLDGTVRRWPAVAKDVNLGSLVKKVSGGIHSIALVPGSRQLVAAGVGIDVISLADNSIVGGTRGHRWQITGIVPLGKDRIATAGRDGTVRLWDGEAGTELACTDTSLTLSSLARSLDGKTLWVGSDEGKLARVVVDTTAETPRLQAEPLPGFENPYRVAGLAVVPGARLMVARAQGLLSIVDDRTGETIVGTQNPQRCAPIQESITKLIASEDGSAALSANPTQPQPWRVEGNQLVAHALPRTDEGNDGVTAMTTVPGSDLVVSGGSNGLLLLWEWNRERGEVKSLHRSVPDHEVKNWVFGMAASPDGQRVATGSLDGHLHVWRVRDLMADESESPKPVEINLRPVGEKVCAVAFGPDSHVLYAGTTSGLLLRFDLPDSK